MAAPRPAVPPTLPALMGAVLLERHVLAEGSVTPGAALVVGLAGLGGALALAVRRRGHDVPGCAALGCLACALAAALSVSWAAVARGEVIAQALAGTSVATWEFEVVSDPSEGTYGERCRAVARGHGLRGQVWLTGVDGLMRGDVLRGVGRFTAVGDDAWGRSSRMQGVCGSVRVVRVQEVRGPKGVARLLRVVRTGALAAIGPERSAARAVLAGCVLGDRSHLREWGLDGLFSSCGVSHLLAVSGGHLAVVTALASAALERSRLGTVARLAVLSAAGGAFVVVSGCAPSAVRAWAMSVVAQGGMLVGRRADALSAVCLAALAMALVDPAVVGQLGFVLSVTCVIGLALFSRYCAWVLEVVVPGVWVPRSATAEARIRLAHWRGELLSSVAAGVVAQMVSLPLVVPLYGRVSLVGPIASAFVTPVLSLAMGGALVGCVTSPIRFLSETCLVVAEWAARCALALLRLMARVPLASVPVSLDAWVAWVAVGGGALTLIALWPTPRRRPLLLCLGATGLVVAASLLSWRYLAPARVVVLDIGQGDAILVQDGPAALLVDAGPDDAIVSALARNHVLHLDAVALTHLHDDHFGGLSSLVGTIGCDAVIVARGVAANLPEGLAAAVRDLSGGSCDEVSQGDVVVVGGFRLEVVWPVVPVAGTTNADSLMLLVTYRDRGRSLVALLTGDAEHEELGSVLAGGSIGDIDLLKVGHHGSEVSLDGSQAWALMPEVSVASAGEGNSYGHPRPECVEALEAVGSRFLCTKDVGDVDVRPGRAGPRVRCQRGP